MSSVVTTPPRTRQCPKCDYQCEISLRECPRCFVVFDKVATAERRRQEAVAPEPAALGSITERLAAATGLVVQQEKEKWEIVTGLETKNRYRVSDETGNALFYVAEQGDGFGELITRWFLKAARPFTMHVMTLPGDPVFVLQRPFRFFLHSIEVQDATGSVLGSVRMRFHLLRRIYDVTDGNGSVTARIVGPFLRPWTFNIECGGDQSGQIKKKWSGAVTELFTDADKFGITFPRQADPRLKAVLLGAVFLIDAAHFENSG